MPTHQDPLYIYSGGETGHNEILKTFKVKFDLRGQGESPPIQ